MVGVAADAPSSLESKPESGLSLPLSRLALRLAVCSGCGSIDVDGTGLSVAARRLSASSSSSCQVLGQFLKSKNGESRFLRGTVEPGCKVHVLSKENWPCKQADLISGL